MKSDDIKISDDLKQEIKKATKNFDEKKLLQLFDQMDHENPNAIIPASLLFTQKNIQETIAKTYYKIERQQENNATKEIFDALTSVEHLIEDLIKTQKQIIEFNKNNDKFKPMLNGTATNKLATATTKSKKPHIDQYTGKATIEQKGFKIFIDRYNELASDLRPSTHALLDICTIELTTQNHYRGKENILNTMVTISLDEYMTLCGTPHTKPSKDRARRIVKEDLETLFHISLEWTEKKGKQTKDFSNIRICSKVEIKKGNIIINFTNEMTEYLTNSYLMQYPIELLKINKNNPHVYHIGRKLALHNSIDNNKRKGTKNIISVKKLLVVCPELPKYEEIKNKDRHVGRHIKEPFEQALNILANKGIIKWEYSNSKGTHLTDEQITSSDYNTFIKLYITFDIIGSPDQTDRLQSKSKKKDAL